MHKYYNKPLGKAPIQEIFAGASYYGGGGSPVVITNNRMTYEARTYAKKLGVEIIADAEWLEIKQVFQSKKNINPNAHKGLMGIIIASILKSEKYVLDSVAESLQEPLTDKQQLKLELISKFDEAEECTKEAARLQQNASQFTQRAITLQKEALLRNLGFK